MSDALPLPYDWPNRDASSMCRAGGMLWHVQRMGEGETVLLLHGTAASTHSWRELLPILAESFDVLAIDLPGHGFSERLPGGSMALTDISDGIADLMHQLGVSPYAIVGHSAGAAIGLELALKPDSGVTHVVGLNAALLPFGGALKKIFSPLARFFASTHLMPKMLARRAQDRQAVDRVLEGTGSSIGSEGKAQYQRLFQREAHLSAVLAMMASWDLQPMLARLPELKASLLLVVAANDKAVSPGEADTIKAVVPDIEIRKLDGLGHLAHEEDPVAIGAIITAFLRDGKKAPAADDAADDRMSPPDAAAQSAGH